MSAILRCSYLEYPFALIIKREADESQTELAERTRDIRDQLAQALPDLKINSPRQRSAPANRIEICPPLTSEDRRYDRITPRGQLRVYRWQVNRLAATTSFMRQALVERLVGTLAEISAPVDWIGLVPWILAPERVEIKLLQAYAFSRGIRHERLLAAESQYRTLKNELMTPFYDGAHPVSQPGLLYDFHQLGLAERMIVAQALNRTVSAALLWPFLPDYGTKKARTRRLWPQLAQRLRAAGWLAQSNKPLSRLADPADGPFLGPGGRARLLNRFQAFAP